MVKELLAHGRVRRAYLGIQIGEVTPDAAKKHQLELRSGVFVTRVQPGGPAANAGMQDEDVIEVFAGERTRSPRDLQDVVEQKEIGSTQAVVVRRGGKQVTLKVVMTALPDELDRPVR